jgi:hypothetical protein
LEWRRQTRPPDKDLVRSKKWMQSTLSLFLAEWGSPGTLESIVDVVDSAVQGYLELFTTPKRSAVDYIHF